MLQKAGPLAKGRTELRWRGPEGKVPRAWNYIVWTSLFTASVILQKLFAPFTCVRTTNCPSGGATLLQEGSIYTTPLDIPPGSSASALRQHLHRRLARLCCRHEIKSLSCF